jgi:hypothetical protein
MALKGNLRDFSVTQLLNLVHLAHKTGTLVVEGSSDLAQLTFREGRLAFAQFGHEDNSLAAILQRGNKISLAQYRTIRERGGHMSDKELGLLLINAGYLSQEDILISIQQYFTGVVQRLYTWADGFFRFENTTMAPDGKITVRIDLENLIIEGSRRMREWEQLQEEIPSLDMALKFTDRPGLRLNNVSLNVQEWKVVSYINPRNTIRQIARTAHMSDLEIRQVVYGLVQAGLAEIVRPEGAPPQIPIRPAFQTTDKVEQKSLINRLIGRIRSL